MCFKRGWLNSCPSSDCRPNKYSIAGAPNVTVLTASTRLFIVSGWSLLLSVCTCLRRHAAHPMSAEDGSVESQMYSPCRPIWLSGLRSVYCRRPQHISTILSIWRIKVLYSVASFCEPSVEKWAYHVERQHVRSGQRNAAANCRRQAQRRKSYIHIENWHFLFRLT